MKRLICLILIISLTLYSLNVAYATGGKHTPDSDGQYVISKTDSGKIFMYSDATKVAVIITDETKQVMDVSIKYPEAPEIVYQLTLLDFSSVNVNIKDSLLLSYWIELLDYAEHQMDNSTRVVFEVVNYDKPIDITSTRSAEGYYFKQILESWHGAEYSDVLMTSTPIYMYNQAFRVYQTMRFNILTNGYNTWSTVITVASLITVVLGLIVEYEIVEILCTIFGVALDVASYLNPGRIDRYICQVMTCKYITINGSNYVYNVTYRFVDYDGYDDGDPNSTAVPEIYAGSMFIWYSHNSDYYNSYYSQIEDAYAMFQNVGQRP